ncbi:MAG: hypothetical protein IT314_01985 [Anaerolineales bacterium]|nr:hypothetical protein [Anaerolineales bacterium]
MKKFRQLNLRFVKIIVFVMLFTAWTKPVLGIGAWIGASSDEEEIESQIRSYFEIRYLMFSNLQVMDFGYLIANSPEAEEFLQTEVDKLKIQIKSLEASRLKYLQYDFYLDFINISVDASKSSATVLVTEGSIPSPIMKEELVQK